MEMFLPVNFFRNLTVNVDLTLISYEPDLLLIKREECD